MAQAATTPTTKESVLEWVKNDKRRLLHVVYRVGDLDKTIKWVYFCSFFKFDDEMIFQQS